MSIHVALRHVTQYVYERPISLGPHTVRLRPAPHCRTPILSYSLRIDPANHFINWQQDPQSNYLARLVFPEKTRQFRVEVDLLAELAVYNPFDFFLEADAERYPFAYDPALRHDLEPFLAKLPPAPKYAEYFEAIKNGLPGKGERPRTINLLVDINQRLASDIQYLIRMEPGIQTPEETLEKRKGSCRDSAWLLCQILRGLGLAARFVSGYIIQLKPDVKALDGPVGAEQDFCDLHAWCEVYLPGAGWIGLDATSGMMAGEGHIPLAATPDPQSAAPVTGTLEKCESTFTYEMSVHRMEESPRVTKPYSPEQWAAIEALGHRIDERLTAGDVRLTMGGEPTFVSIDDPDGPEWNIEALGPRKRLLAGDLIQRLRGRFAPGGLLHYGQGKWYPGEALPRWALGCYWRRDGAPVWSDASLIADESKNYGHGAKEAHAYISRLMELLEVDPQWLMPAYEDIYYYLWKERRLPANVDPLKSNLKDEQERNRIAGVFQQGLGTITGWALPIKADKGKWNTGPWFLRDETLWLIPGDSPLGFRLPLDSLPWVSESDYPWIHPADLSGGMPPLPASPDRGGQRYLAGAPAPLPPGCGPGQRNQWLEPPPGKPAGEEEEIRRPGAQESAASITRTALCVEPREGRLHVFMPPVKEADDYLDMIAAVEQTSRTLGMPVIIEGEAPPRDPRLNAIKVTPDPGVIEVNTHPASSWDELVKHTNIVYEEARQSRLGAEKFMLDGRHAGTGGGNHITIGGQSPADSPMLRRPDLLRSLLAYWHNHPSLSYLFAGLFIGPTCQAPRVDEARNDSVYELEIAFRQIPEKGEAPPWLVDRIFRNLLVDSTGNTHRSEFSIDKLYAPDGPAGRLGLVEMRSFEMPPHAEMSLAQHLLLRAAIAHFWEKPYAPRELARWNTQLHDRWMLPHFVREDLEDVIGDLKTGGFELEPAWFAPHFEFRFPGYGAISHRGVHLELRSALEPWNVLGEDPAAGGTVRFVDSSLERLEVKVRGLTDTRHAIACNGRRVPLHPTGTAGEYVAGVRYRAWQPPECLQPAIGVHAPLVFDILDTWNHRSIGGCTYHVTHPGGRNYSTFPVNANEAESRRLERFIAFGHTPGPMILPPAETNREMPMTLDLRK
ncbi:MAG TPA: transglutaminase family protein [Chthoniobacteraceae bacterium]|jgi:uncharacterized protein (DUF2126 family)|nr:transglutaminase family protein [Chthoniobacteraceae bacterium]